MGILRGHIVDGAPDEQIDAKVHVLTSDGRLTHPREAVLKRYLEHMHEKVEQTFLSAQRHQIETSESCVRARRERRHLPKLTGASGTFRLVEPQCGGGEY